MGIRFVYLSLGLPSGLVASIHTGAQHAGQVKRPQVMRYVLPSGELPGVETSSSNKEPLQSQSLLRGQEENSKPVWTYGHDRQVSPETAKHLSDSWSSIFNPRHDPPVGVIGPTAGQLGVVLTMHMKADAGKECP